MGTRADFYVGRGEDAEWIGSIAWDGYPSGITPHGEETKREFGRVSHVDAEWPEGAHLFDATTEEAFRQRVERFFQYRDDVTRPADGWPWPWNDSNTTDYAYALDGGTVWGTCFGRGWWPAGTPPQDDDEDGAPPVDKVTFPDMSSSKALTFGPRSGLLVFGA